MSANDEYDDLDDLLGDVGVKKDILSKSPGSSKESPLPTSSANQDSAAAPREVNAKNIKASQPEPSAIDVSNLSLEDDDEAFAQQLKGGMDELLKETEGDQNTQKLIEALIGSIQQPTSPKQTAKDTDQPPATAPPSFEDTISATMGRLNESQRPNADEQGGADFMERMLKELQNSASGGEGAGGLEDLLSTMMSELSTKEVLYEPMKDMHTKYPEWMATKGREVSAEELKRFQQQQAIVSEIVAAYEAPNYSDSNQETRQFITAKMEEMQNTGAPPEELVGDIAGGSFMGANLPDLASGGLPPMPSDCATQ